MSSTWLDIMLGRLRWDDITLFAYFRDPDLNNAVASTAGAIELAGLVAVLLLISYFKFWGRLWRDWLTSVDHKKIGIMYIVLALVMLTRGVLEGFVMRIQQATALEGGIIETQHYAELFSTHGSIMIFFVAMPLIFGLINYILPLQIGARDVAFPALNQISLALTAVGALLLMVSLVIGQFETGGWTAYPPYTGKDFSPGVGPDYWIWAIFFSGIGSTLSAINFAVTIYKMRAPGMAFMHMPMFVWTVICTSILMIYALPPLTVVTAMMALDRYADFHFFTNDLGGNMMNYANLFWMFGHPEVYILILPAYGIFSEISSTFAGKKLYGYRSLVLATMSIAVLSFLVWLHHFFTMGQSATVNAVFGIATMVIAVPTGVKVYDWLATLYKGRIRITTPVVYLIGFFILFVIGGLSGVILANPSLDYQIHNSLFLVAHFHNVLIPGLLFGLLAGLHYWWPKMFGFRLHETWGRACAYCWIVGFSLTFLPLYWLGMMGMPRRSATFNNPAFEPWMIVSLIGACVLVTALALFFTTIVVSIKKRSHLATPLGDPWNGHTLEWWCSAPPPLWNFAQLPKADLRYPFTEAKQQGYAYSEIKHYQTLSMPGNTTIGFSVLVLTSTLAFALVWHIWWLSIAAAIGLQVSFIRLSFIPSREEIIDAAHIAQHDRHWRAQARTAQPVSRAQECSTENLGKALAYTQEVI